ncbi:MAG: oligosaccharide repeat unit polymerase [Bacteroidetes bacterium]|nr:oligosaccharide repeat unit polymerase [Bacteroidota bacterium]
MSAISLISFIIVIALLLEALKKESDLFSPARVFSIIWISAIGLAELKLSWLQHEWTLYGWGMLLIGIFSFYLGVFIVFVINLNRPMIPISRLRIFYSENVVNKNKFLILIAILFLIYTGSYLANYLIEGFVPIFSNDPARARGEFGVFGIGLLLHAATALIILIAEYITLIKMKRIFKYFLIFLILFIFVTYFFLLQRFNLMFAIISVLAFLYYSSNVIKPRYVVIFILVIVGLMYSVQFFRTASVASTYLNKIAHMKYNVKYAVFTEPYMYVVMNLENFTRAVEKLDSHTFGFYSFNFITSLAGVKKMIAEYLHLNNFPYLNSSFNTYTMFWDYFRDFGVFGLSIIPFLMGTIISIIYNKLRTNPNLMNISAYSICVFVIFISFFVNIIGLLHFFFNVVVIMTITKIAQNNFVKYNY